jgi:prefoldin subunit 5
MIGLHTINSTNSSLQSAHHDADALRSPILGMQAQIGLLKATFEMVRSNRAEDAINEAIEAMEKAINELEIGADKVIADAENGGF